MKKYIPYIVSGLVFILALTFLARSCSVIDKYSKLKGQYEEARRIAEADHAIQLKAIEDAQRVISERDQAIAQATERIGSLSAAIANKTEALAALDKDLADAKTDAERVPILTSMVETWKAKYANLEGIVVEKDKQLGEWAVKYAAQVSISESWKGQYESEHRLRLLGEGLVDTLEGRLKRASLTSQLKTVTLVAVAGVLGYTLIKGK